MTSDNIERCHPCARAAGTFPNCPASGIALLTHAEGDYCPLTIPRFGNGVRPPHFGEGVAIAEPSAKLLEMLDRRRAERGRHAWYILHVEGPGQGPDWLAEWEKSIPCGECRRKYDGLKAADPPTFPLTFEWGWKIHDAVNADLGKERMGLEEARERWFTESGSLSDPD